MAFDLGSVISAVSRRNTGCVTPDRVSHPRASKIISGSLVLAIPAILLVGGCRSLPVVEAAEPSGNAAVERLTARFPESWTQSTYMIATVQTPEELWNVYVVSVPPDQVAVRQSRQDGEYEFGMIDDLIWHVAFGKSEPTVIDQQWAWFIRNHEIFRFSEWLGTLQFQRSNEPERLGSCSTVSATDAFKLDVTLCVDASGFPSWIERETPATYGEQRVRFEVLEWSEWENQRIMKKFRMIQGSSTFEWEVQGLMDVPADQRIQPPQGLVAD